MLNASKQHRMKPGEILAGLTREQRLIIMRDSRGMLSRIARTVGRTPGYVSKVYAGFKPVNPTPVYLRTVRLLEEAVCRALKRGINEELTHVY